MYFGSWDYAVCVKLRCRLEVCIEREESTYAWHAARIKAHEASPPNGLDTAPAVQFLQLLQCVVRDVNCKTPSFQPYFQPIPAFCKGAAMAKKWFLADLHSFNNHVNSTV